MKLKILLITAITFCCGTQLLAQAQIPQEDYELGAKLIAPLNSIGNNLDFATAHLDNFYKIRDDANVVVYRYLPDTAVYVGFRKDAQGIVTTLSLLLPHHYLTTITLMLTNLKMNLLKTTDKKDFAEFQNEQNTAYLNAEAGPGMMVLIMNKREGS